MVFVLDHHLKCVVVVVNDKTDFICLNYTYNWVCCNLVYINLVVHYHLLVICDDWDDNLNEYKDDLNSIHTFYFSEFSFYFFFDTLKKTEHKYLIFFFFLYFFIDCYLFQSSLVHYPDFLSLGCWKEFLLIDWYLNCSVKWLIYWRNYLYNRFTS